MVERVTGDGTGYGTSHGAAGQNLDLVNIVICVTNNLQDKFCMIQPEPAFILMGALESVALGPGLEI
jgi:hypothetical protein